MSSSDEHWIRSYGRDQFPHVLVVLGFALYPILLGVLNRTPLASEASAFLPGLTFMIIVLYMGLFAISFDFISGYTGYLSFGHAAFYGTGAYFVVLAANGQVPGVPEGTPFMITMLLGATLAFVVALAIGAVSFRLTGVYFAMLTLGFAQVMYEFIRHWGYVSSNPTEGATIPSGADMSIGVPFVDSLNFAVGRLSGDSFENVLGVGIDVSATMTSYYALGIVVLLSYFVMQRIIHSPFGKVMIAIRENEERARAVGYNVFWYKMGAFATSAFFAAIAGALFAAYAGGASPDNSFYFLVTADALIMAIIGGIGTLAGPLFGALFHEWFEDILSTESDGLSTYLEQLLPESVLTAEVAGLTINDFIGTFLDGRAPLYLGIIFVLFVLFVPNGLLGSIRDRLGGTVSKRLPATLERYRR
ncbi:branched-chain amino acid ABC transporter permease [Natrialba sp. SSL1]|uniref:branched-chain amino acid ABC transporter permease n=1 Tax=Natrialba sp. SSL1 TaxID=1869245 RepID=UPI0008F968AB|nr:branched-chain amino acid ABC transporter permease [Natrialba sp. SSL1]OIB57800.1 branched-chain amino acid ABC transporter permease [Natrialba sp. SSL1]